MKDLNIFVLIKVHRMNVQKEILNIVLILRVIFVLIRKEIDVQLICKLKMKHMVYVRSLRFMILMNLCVKNLRFVKGVGQFNFFGNIYKPIFSNFFI